MRMHLQLAFRKASKYLHWDRLMARGFSAM